ncbi:hypothetical protein PV08_01404 [Exophiala spinifera]|uniref:ribonuclease H n=1 Tax=Exophiala spinifera TaxID=91928 RepID=A0A0D1YZS5_9EURO|nr:uncharacterized protein PV08_01404 [Exophiala spinifera]KIW20826.1 hypothetical protein PV08_01404 [Exophiala spinifera]
MDDEEGVICDRKVDLCCPTTAVLSVPELIQTCPECGDFVLYCCACNSSRPRKSRPCHHYRIVFTDGACTNNGRPEATAGVGVAYGENDGSQLSVPITDTEDDFPLRSNQRAELYAARLGLEFLAEADRIRSTTKKAKGEPKAWIIATDSEYVVKGITEWLPTWRRNDWRTSKGTKPANLDLFLALDDALASHEAKKVKIGFWHIPREYNQLADRLAKAAAIDGDVAGM